MPKVYHTVKHYRTNFRKLAFGQPYWLSASVSGQPRIKRGRTSYLNGWNTDGSPVLGTEADTSVAVVKVPETFLSQNHIGE